MQSRPRAMTEGVEDQEVADWVTAVQVCVCVCVYAWVSLQMHALAVWICPQVKSVISVLYSLPNVNNAKCKHTSCNYWMEPMAQNKKADQNWASESRSKRERRWKTAGWRGESWKREIVTTELVAGADFFHHLPCDARRQSEDWERIRVKPQP